MTLRLIGGVLLLAFGAWISFLNWTVFWQGFVQKQQTRSWTPLLGAVLMALGLLAVSENRARAIWWVPFLLDWGSAPGLLFTLVGIWRRQRS